MIGKMIDVLKRSFRNPRYLWYFMQNVHIIRDRFPSLHQIFLRRKKLNLGNLYDLTNLHVILRTTDYVMNLNASRHLESVGIVTRNDVIRVGGCSLFFAAANFAQRFGSDRIRVTLVVDRLSKTGLEQYKKAAKEAGIVFDVVQASGHGNGLTFQSQIDVALKDADDTLALILEDDYMLEKEALSTCFEVMRKHSEVIGMNPHFHPDRVRFQDIGKMSIIGGKLYARVFSTCCTFFMPVVQMRKYEKKLRLYNGWEKGSVGAAWATGICLAPLGWTLAEHLHKSDLSPVNKLMEDGSE